MNSFFFLSDDCMSRILRDMVSLNLKEVYYRTKTSYLGS